MGLSIILHLWFLRFKLIKLPRQMLHAEMGPTVIQVEYIYYSFDEGTNIKVIIQCNTES